MATLKSWLSFFAVFIFMTKVSVQEDVNFALGKPAVQSSVYKGYDASKGVDGNPNSGVANGFCANTIPTPFPAWWMVDLLSNYEIHTVKLNGRHSRANAFRQFTVHLSKYNPLKNLDFPNGTKGELCFYREDKIGDGGKTKTFQCTRPLVGRYLTLAKTTSGWLVLCELQAMGSLNSKTRSQHFQMLANYKSTEPPFYYRDGVVSAFRCGLVCLNAPGGITTMFNYQVSTGLCQCIQLSELTSDIGEVYDSDTQLYVSVYN